MPRDVDIAVRPEVFFTPDALAAAAANAAGIARADVREVQVLRRAIDARRGVRFQLLVRLHLHGDPEVGREPASRPSFPPRRGGAPVAVIGAGPAGLFAALRLAEHGIPVVVFERGKPVQARRRDIAALTKRGIVDPESNYCFGEGGAGTYSDGKLYTRAQKRGSVTRVLETLVAHGADPDILVDARPHVGSNRLPKIVTALRETLASAGVEIRFGERVDDVVHAGGLARAVRTSVGEELPIAAVVLATGHSARDVFHLAAALGCPLEAKPFAVGVRVEHPQPLIDRVQYGADAGRTPLPAASYRLATTVQDRGVFSFCMCPGGWIVPATTASDELVVNGMSLARRDSPFANSGIVVALTPDDVAALGFAGPLGGLALQAGMERMAYQLGGGAQVAPAQRLQDFIAGRESVDLPATSYVPGVRAARLDAALPAFVAGRLRDAFRRFARTLRGYDTRDAVAVGVETRSSSPVRIVRDAATLASPALANLYPCGEGGGYAGGIVSAALDGIAVADALAAADRGRRLG